ncbi:MAG: LysR family transcriptional regulator [Clostridia bacterium]|nr:LysR family transcriptional regulator [Clostridia bacterium]
MLPLEIGMDADQTRKGPLDLNFQYYINYVTIVEEGSLTQAAHKLRVAQPALSNQIKALEDVYGTRLFHRGSGSRRLELTDAGRILYEKACIMVNAEAAARTEISGATGTSTGALRLGIDDSLGHRYLVRALDQFSERYPEAEIILHEAKPDELIKMMQYQLVEAILVRSYEKQTCEDFEVMFSQQDYLVAAYRQNVFFVGNTAEIIPIRELAKFPLGVAEENLPELRAAFREEGCTFTPRFMGTNLQACILWAQSGKGVALIPRLSLPMLGYTEMPFKHIGGKPLGETSLSIVTQKKQYRSRIVNNFLDVCALLNGDKVTLYRPDMAQKQEKTEEK